MKKILKIHPSNYLFYGSIVLLVFIDIVGPLLIVYQFFIYRSNNEIIVFFFMVIIAVIFTVIFFLSELKQWISTIYITDTHIKTCEIFKKIKIMDYAKYNNLYYGFVCVRGIPEWFIIISNRKMSRFELENLNKIKQTDDFIKIEYSKKRREKLMEILPQNMACQLKNPPPGKK